jgi:hypothetical protein
MDALTQIREFSLHQMISHSVWNLLVLRSAWTAGVVCLTISSSSDYGEPSSMKTSISGITPQ